MKLWEKQSIFTQNITKLINFIYDNEMACTFGEVFRTPEQAAIYAKQGKGIKDSLHCKRLAVDLNLFTLDGTYLTDSKSYKKFGEYWVTLHPFNRWGGVFPRVDANHFEMQDL